MAVRTKGKTLVEETPIQTVSIHPKTVGRLSAQVDPTLAQVPIRPEGVPNLHSLQIGHDAVTDQFGLDVYDKMILDDEVEANLGVLTAALASQEIRLEPAITTGASRAKAKLLVEFCRWVMAHFSLSERSGREALVREMIKNGSAVGEILFQWKSPEECELAPKIKKVFGVGSAGFLIPTEVAPKCLCDISLVVDTYNRVIGIVPRKLPGTIFPDGQAFPVELVDGRYRVVNRFGSEDPVSSTFELTMVIPRSKFVFLTWTPRCNDPRGDSGLMSAYAPWWVKQQTLLKMMQWIDKFAKPALVGKVGENAQAQCITNEDGTETIIEPTETLLATLQQFEGGTALALPFGYELDLLKGMEGGEIFLKILDAMDRRITRAMTLQHLATSDGGHASLSSSGSHQDILGMYVIAMRQRVGDALQRDLFRPLIEWNFGREWTYLTPKVLIGDGDGFPISPMEASQLMSSGYLASEQLPDIDRLLGVPPRSEATSILMEMAQQKSVTTSAGIERGSLDREDSTLTKDMTDERGPGRRNQQANESRSLGSNS